MLTEITVEQHRDLVNKKYEEIFEIYKDTQLSHRLILIENMIYSRNYKEAERSLSEFKDENQLMEELEFKLKDKPINNTLKKIRKGTIESKEQVIKGLFSLGTHAMIECERGNMEYMYVARRIHSKLSEQLRTG
jgi:hypothetical protein